MLRETEVLEFKSAQSDACATMQVYTEGLVKRVRKARAEAEKMALEGKAAAASAGAAEEDIASQVSLSLISSSAC